MPFINAAVATAKELTAVPEGRYPLRVLDADVVPVKRDNPDKSKEQIAVTISIDDAQYPSAQQVYMYLGLPHRDDDERTVNRKLLSIRRFCTQFDIPFEESGFNTDDFVGATCDEGHLTQEPVKDANDQETGEFRNNLRLARLPGEAAEEAPKAQTRRRRA
jgi:hypothetical protein